LSSGWADALIIARRRPYAEIRVKFGPIARSLLIPANLIHVLRLVLRAMRAFKGADSRVDWYR